VAVSESLIALNVSAPVAVILYPPQQSRSTNPRRTNAAIVRRIDVFVKADTDLPAFVPSRLVQQRSDSKSRHAKFRVHVNSCLTLGIALSTVKWHLLKIFEKTGTSRQVDLVRMVVAASPQIATSTRAGVDLIPSST
jgi:hypothetical protein